MTSRKAVVAMAVIIPILLGVSIMGYASVTAAGGTPSDNNNNNFFGNPRCTTTVSLPEVAGGVIQNAITAASPGAVICVSAGVYPEQLTITKPLTLEGLGTPHNPTEIQPTAVVQNSADPDTSTPEYSIILVGGGTSSITGVTISNLVVDGSLASSTFTGCGDDYDGLLFLNAGGMITGSTVQNIYLPVALAGCQPGDAIEVQTAAALSSSVTISNDQALNYNKNGITCNDVGSTCNITQNTVSFYSAYAAYIASNGIQIGYGAVGTVSQNTVSGNECNVATVCGPNLVSQTQSVGILTYQSGAGTTVKGNTVSGNDVGIATVNDKAISTNNQIQDNRYEGLLVNDGTYGDSNNQLSCDHHSSCLIGIAEVSDGFVASPTNATFDDSSFTGTFATAMVQVTAYTGAPNGGTNVESATLSINGLTETVTAGASSSPSLVNLTAIPNLPFGLFH